MLLSDEDILSAMRYGELEVDPFDPGLMQPASLDVRLGSEFLVFRRSHLDVVTPFEDQGERFELRRVKSNGSFLLFPEDFVLASTMETIHVGEGLAARLEGKSSLGRLGLLTHATAGFIDPGFHGQITLELKNLLSTPLVLQPGMKIGQLCVFRMSSPAVKPYGTPGLGSRYQGQRGPTESR